jgi:hypothetical protein
MTKTKQLEAHVDALVYDTKTVDVRLHNTFNQFLMLSNSQFIENVCRKGGGGKREGKERKGDEETGDLEALVYDTKIVDVRLHKPFN